jgi:hypothetical protein
LEKISGNSNMFEVEQSKPPVAKKRWRARKGYDPKLDFPPKIQVESFPSGERETIAHVTGLLSLLWQYLITFESAIELYEFCSVQRYKEKKANPDGGYQPKHMYHEWQFMAVRDGALTLYHFAKAVEGIRRSQAGAPMFRGYVDHAIVRSAVRQFLEAFPSAQKMRHAVAHDAELMATLADSTKNFAQVDEVELDGFKIPITRSIIDGKFSTSIDGEVISYELTDAALDKLNSVKREIFRAFQNACRPPKPPIVA